jgi:hypothetical protein
MFDSSSGPGSHGLHFLSPHTSLSGVIAMLTVCTEIDASSNFTMIGQLSIVFKAPKHSIPSWTHKDLEPCFSSTLRTSSADPPNMFVKEFVSEVMLPQKLM